MTYEYTRLPSVGGRSLPKSSNISDDNRHRKKRHFVRNGRDDVRRLRKSEKYPSRPLARSLVCQRGLCIFQPKTCLPFSMFSLPPSRISPSLFLSRVLSHEHISFDLNYMRPYLEGQNKLAPSFPLDLLALRFPRRARQLNKYHQISPRRCASAKSVVTVAPKEFRKTEGPREERGKRRPRETSVRRVRSAKVKRFRVAAISRPGRALNFSSNYIYRRAQSLELSHRERFTIRLFSPRLETKPGCVLLELTRNHGALDIIS